MLGKTEVIVRGKIDEATALPYDFGCVGIIEPAQRALEALLFAPGSFVGERLVKRIHRYFTVTAIKLTGPVTPNLLTVRARNSFSSAWGLQSTVSSLAFHSPSSNLTSNRSRFGVIVRNWTRRFPSSAFTAIAAWPI